MINLIKANLYKDFKDKKIYVYILLIIFVSVLVLLLINKNIDLNNSNYEAVSRFNEKQYKSVYKYGSYEQYLIKYNIYDDVVNTEKEKNSLIINSPLRYLLDYSLNFTFVLGLLIIFVCYHSLSYEYQNNVLKYLFLCNYKREEVFFSKLVSVFLLALFFLLIMLITCLFTSCLVTGENLFLLKDFVYVDGFKEIPYLLVYLYKIFINFIPLLFLCILSFFVCVLLRGSSLGLYITFSLYFLSLPVCEFMFNRGINVIKYTFLPYLDFTYLSDQVNVSYNNMIYNLNYSYLNSIFVLVIYGLLLLSLSLKLIKRDI